MKRFFAARDVLAELQSQIERLKVDIQSLTTSLAREVAESERLQTIIDNLHTVEEKHRETANAEFHRANRLQVDNERLTKERDEARAAETEYRRKSHKLTDDRDNPLAGI